MAMKELIQKMLELSIEYELIEAVISLLDTDEQYEKMNRELDHLQSLTTTTILGKALLISEE